MTADQRVAMQSCANTAQANSVRRLRATKARGLPVARRKEPSTADLQREAFLQLVVGKSTRVQLGVYHRRRLRRRQTYLKAGATGVHFRRG